MNSRFENHGRQVLEPEHFPTRQQAVVWRNWELVPVERLARILDSTEENVLELARGLGLSTPPEVGADWLSRGYITLIRNNWHLLSRQQLLQLLGWTPEQLEYTLKEDDFLWHKLGQFKPEVEPVRYRPLTGEETKRTEEINALLRRHFPLGRPRMEEKPFAFLEHLKKPVQPVPAICSAAGKEDTVLDDTWQIFCTGWNQKTRGFAERFRQMCLTRWGTRLTVTEQEPGTRCILLQVNPDTALLSESHTIQVGSDRIDITAVDEVGLLRGLQWLEKEMEKRGGPFVKRQRLKRKTRFDLRLIYSYAAVYGDPFLDPNIDPFPEGLLSRLSNQGVNGIWMPAVLYKLVPWEAAPELSVDWEKRLTALRRFTRRAAQYGINLYLYLNEPRAMPESFFQQYPEWKGEHEGDFYALCTSCKPVQDYLRKGVEKLFTEVPDLGGIVTITMSENLTNCYSRIRYGNKMDCPRCAKRLPHEVVAEVNRLMAEGAHRAKPDAKVICWTWGWSENWGWEKAWTRDIIDLLPEKAAVMCVSEDEKPFRTGGIEGKVIDYSISIVGPSPKSRDIWERAEQRGLQTLAKVQLNNSWECSAVPYIPVMDLVREHLENLKAAGVSGLMLSWTLGGYPSLNLEIASHYYWEDKTDAAVSLEEIAAGLFGKNAGSRIIEAWSCFSRAFKEFPFDVGTLYCAPQNYGPRNLFYREATGYQATMLGFPYDDLSSWRSIYPEDIFEAQFKKLAELWRKGVEILEGTEEKIEASNMAVFLDLLHVSKSLYCHFYSTYLQIAFVRRREALINIKDDEEKRQVRQELCRILEAELENTKGLIKIIRKDSRIGFEPSNHYYYSMQDLLEKILNCEQMKTVFEAC